MIYRIVSGIDREQLEERVNKLIENEYRPQGGVMLDSRPGMFEGETFREYLQAMMKEETP